MKIKINRAEKILFKWMRKINQGQYEPIIKVWSGPKSTRRHLLRGFKSERNHHFLSDGEYRTGIYYESLPKTINYFEQFPLWDMGRAIRIAHEMGIKYPQDKDREAYVMSTDLLCLELNPEEGGFRKVARSYKPLDSFLTKHPVSISRTLDKLELERRYYEEEGISFELITDADISKRCASNLKACRQAAWYKDELIVHEEAFMHAFLEEWFTSPNEIIKVLLEKISRKLGISYSDCYGLFQWGIWTHQIPADLECPINPLRPLIMNEVA